MSQEPLSASPHLQINKQLDYILGILHNRRERYKLFWSALTGLMVAIVVGLGLRVLLEQLEQLAPINIGQIIWVIIFASFGLFYFFLSIFFELHIIDDMTEAVINLFYWEDGPLYMVDELPIQAALKFIDAPIASWDSWKRLERVAFAPTVITALFGIMILYIFPEYENLYVELGFLLLVFIFAVVVVFITYKRFQVFEDVRIELKNWPRE